MIRPSKGQTKAAHRGILQRPPVRDGPQGPPLRAGGRPDPAADLRRHAQARRPAPAGAGAGGEARRRTQLRPRRSPHSGGDGHPRAEAGPWHRGPRSVDRLAGGPARQRPHAQARDGGRAAGRAPDHRAGAGGARRAQRDRRGDRGAGGDPSPPGAEDASRRAGHRGGLAVPLRAGGSVQETIRDEWKNELKATSALRAFERVTTVLTVTPALRIPMVAMVGNRALDDPGAFGVEHNDALAVRDLGWQLVWVDNAQEALDTALIAYRVAEDRRVFLPCAIACDGAFLTHSQALTKIPPQEWVDAFLPPYNRGDLLLHPDNPITVAPQVNEDWLMELRKHNDEAIKRSKNAVIPEAYRDFERIFNRSYGNPFFEEYQTEDADIVLVGMGTLSMPVKVAIRQMRKEGKKVGFVRVRWFRPFPAEDLAQTLGRFKAVGVIDRDYSFGSPYFSGVLATEVRAALYPAAKRPPVVGFICGLGGREVTVPDVRRMSEMVFKSAGGETQPLITWIGIRE